MRVRPLVASAVMALTFWSAVFAYQRRDLRSFLEEEDNPAPIPADAMEKTEYVFARMRYPSMRRGWGGNGSWSTDYPKADRQFVQGVRRLSRVHVRSMEEVVDLDTDKLFDYPWIYLTEPGTWNINEAQAAKLREYMLRGGFVMTDDFHGTVEWEIFVEGMRKVFPDREVVDLESREPIFHVLYDLDERFQVAGIQYLFSNRLAEKDGVEAKWRGIYDDRGRLMMAISHNMDLGDAWEWADHPMYPERFSSLAYRVGINYIIYSMTH